MNRLSGFSFDMLPTCNNTIIVEMRCYVVFFLITVINAGCKENIHPHVQFTGVDSVVINGKFNIPAVPEKSCVVIWVTPCLNDSYIPDSTSKNYKNNYTFLIKKELLKRGVINFEFYSERDSLVLAGSKYPGATLNTKIRDLDAAISYIRSKKGLRDKKIVLMGCSEGGASSAVVASRNHDVAGIVLISAPGVKGNVFMDYQQRCKDTLLCSSYGFPEFYETVFSTVSFNAVFEKDLQGFLKFRDSCSLPLQKILFKNMDSGIDFNSNALEIMQYLRRKWDREDSGVRKLNENFEKYCKMFGTSSYIQPEQIALFSWNSDLYFSKIGCPVLLVYGTKDQCVEYKSSLENIKRMLLNGGNPHFSEIVFNGRDHLLQCRDRPAMNDKDIKPVVDWIVTL